MLKKNYIELNIFWYAIFILIVKKFDNDLRKLSCAKRFNYSKSKRIFINKRYFNKVIHN